MGCDRVQYGVFVISVSFFVVLKFGQSIVDISLFNIKRFIIECDGAA